MFSWNLCDRIIDKGLPANQANRPQTVPACYDSTKKCSLHWSGQSSPTKIARPVDGFLNLGRLGLVLEPLIQGGSA